MNEYLLLFINIQRLLSSNSNKQAIYYLVLISEIPLIQKLLSPRVSAIV